jgi:hypothetical protein
MTPLLAIAVLLGPPVELGTLFDAAALAALPSGREPWSLLRTAEAVVTADRIESGGLFLGAPALFGVHGASWTETTWRLGDIDITDPDRGGTPMITVPVEALQSLTLSSALTPVAGAGSGARVALAVREAEDAWRGALTLHTTPSGLAGSGEGIAPPIASMRGWDDLSVIASGPVGSRLGLFAAARGTRGERQERASAALLRSEALALLAHAVYRPNSGDEWRLIGAASGANRPFAGRARLADPAPSEEQRSVHVQAGFIRRGPAGPGWRAALAYQETGETPPLVTSGVFEIEELRDEPVAELYAPRRRVRRFDMSAAVSPGRLRFGGRNEATLGLALEQSAASWSTAGPASRGLTAERVGGLPARVWDFGFAAVESSAHGSHLALFVDDRLDLGRSLQVEGGLRFALWRAAGETGGGRIAWTTLSPRVAARWSPFRVFGLFAGWERVHPRLPLRHLQWGDPGGPQGRVYRWDDDGDGRYQTGEQGPLVAVVGPGGASAAIDGALRSPQTAGVVAGFDLRPADGWWIRFAGIHRRASGLVDSVNTGVTAADYATSFIDDPAVDIVGPADDRPLPVFARDPASFGRDRYTLTNPADHDVLHEGVELTVERRLAQSLLLRVGGTASRSTGAGGNRGYGVLENDPGVIGELFDQPNADTYARGRLFFDRAYTLKVAGLWRPRDWSFGAVANYQDGQPFARVVVVPGLPQGAEAVPAIRRSEHRFTFTLTVDARVERAFRVGKGRVAVAVEAFNLLDMKNEVEEDIASGASFRRVTAIQPPRAIRLGLRLER